MIARQFSRWFFVCMMLSGVTAAQAQEHVLRAGAFSAGSVAGHGAGLTFQSTLGQSVQGRLVGSGVRVSGGFWHQVRPAGPLALPVAVADDVMTDEDTSVSIDVMANDVDPAGHRLTLTAFTTASNGTVDQTGPDTLTYTPEPEFNGEDSFTYTVSNSQGGSAQGIVVITVQPVNDAPIFISDPIRGVAAGEAYIYTVEGFDLDGDVPRFSAPVIPDWLALTDHGDGTATLQGVPTNAEVGEHDVVLRADDDAAIADQSFTVVVILGVPAGTELITPEDQAVNVLPPLTLTWKAVPGAATYDLQVAAVVNFAATLLDERGLRDTTFDVSELESGTTYFWRVRAVNSKGESEYPSPYRFTVAATVATEEEADLPEQFTLQPNYPNPFNPQTTIRYAVPKPAHVRLAIYDVLGREVRRLVDRRQGAGRYEVVFDAVELGSGLYLYRMDASDFVQTRQMLLTK